MPEPLKRHVALQPITREHHLGLQLCWKIRQGFKNNISLERMKRYADWFWSIHLVPHFNFEEEFVFPILGREHQLTKRAMREHKRLKRLFTSTEKSRWSRNLHLIELELVGHIRFEERILFKEIQKVANERQLEDIQEAHALNVTEEWDDPFWL